MMSSVISEPRSVNVCCQVETVNPVSMMDELTPYAIIPMQYPPGGTLVSDWPEKFSQSVYRYVSHAHSCMQVYMHIFTCLPAIMRACTHSYANSCMNTHTCTHVCTCMHAHTQKERNLCTKQMGAESAFICVVFTLYINIYLCVCSMWYAYK